MLKLHSLFIFTSIFLFYIRCQNYDYQPGGPDPHDNEQNCEVSCEAIAMVVPLDNGEELNFIPCCFNPCKECPKKAEVVCIARTDCEGNDCFFNGLACQECKADPSLFYTNEPCPDEVLVDLSEEEFGFGEEEENVEEEENEER